MELTGLQTQLQTAVNLAIAEETASRQASESTTVGKPVLSGENVKVRTSTDFEKLLAIMESENKDRQVDSAKTQLSTVLAILTGRYGMTSGAFAAVTAATDDLTQAAAVTAEAQAAYDASQATLAAETEKLGDLNENLEKLTAELEKIVDAGGDTKAMEEEIAALQDQVQEQAKKVSEQQNTVNADARALETAQAGEAAAEAALASAVANLDAALASQLLVGVDALARQLVAATREQPGAEKTEEKATEIVKALDSYVSRLDEMREDDIREAVAKIVPDLVFLVTANYHVAPGDLPQYERRV